MNIITLISFLVESHCFKSGCVDVIAGCQMNTRTVQNV